MAFKELYTDCIPSRVITKIDLDKKVVSTEFEEYPFEDTASSMPNLFTTGRMLFISTCLMHKNRLNRL